MSIERKKSRTKSSDEKSKILQEFIEKQEECKRRFQEEMRLREEEFKALLQQDDDEDIEIEQIEQESEESEDEVQEKEDFSKVKNYDSLISKSKNSKNKTLLGFLAMTCPSILEVVNLDGVEKIEGVEKSVNEKTVSTRVEKKICKEKSKSSGDKYLSESEIESFKLDRGYYLIYGAVQSGKTNFLQGISLAHILLSRCAVVVILRNCKADAQQLHDRCNDFIEEQKRYFKKCGVRGGDTLKYFYVGGNKSEESLREAVNNCDMIVAIAHKTHLNRLEKALKPGVKYVTVIDEADSVAYGNDDVNFRKTLHDCVLENSGRTYAITATTFNVIFSEKKIPTENIVRLPIKDKYRGLRKIQMKVIDSKNENELEHYLTLLSDRNAYEHHSSDILHGRTKKTDHPLIMLIKKVHIKIKQQELARKVSDIGNWSEVIVFNGEGLTIYTKYIVELGEIIRRGVKGEKFKIKGKTCRVEQKERKDCLVVKAHIDQGLQYFRELHKKRKMTHIAIVSDGMADRGISFVSKDYKWHLTTQYYEPNKYVFADNIIQSIRLCGNYDDDLPSVLYSTEKVCDDLTKCFLLQEEMIQRCKESELGKSIPSTLKRLPLCVDKLPKKRKFGVKECNLKNVVEGDDGGVSIKEYNKLLKKIDRLKIEEEEKEISDGNIYTVDIEALEGALHKAASDTVDKITENNKWVDRKILIEKLVEGKIYKLSTIRAYLTRIQQSVVGKSVISKGLNFREKSNGEIELLYKPF